MHRRRPAPHATQLSHVLLRSAGKPMDWDGTSYTIEELTEESFSGVDIALFSAGGSISKKFAPIASDAGCTVSRKNIVHSETDILQHLHDC